MAEAFEVVITVGNVSTTGIAVTPDNTTLEEVEEIILSDAQRELDSRPDAPVLTISVTVEPLGQTG